MIVGIPQETMPDERRVAAVPETCARLVKAGFDVWVQRGAGAPAGFPDAEYEGAGAKLMDRANDLYAEASLILKVQGPTDAELAHMRERAILVGLLQPLHQPRRMYALAARRITALAMELMPRITRAQKMDALSAMSTVAGYKAVLLAADRLDKFFPLLMTAAGTIKPARVLILGAGVAGLQAIASARRLGAIVEAFDVRPVVKEQVESLGAKFVEVDAPAEDAQDAGGYAKEVSEAYKLRQREAIARHVKDADVVICTALIPAKRAPILVTADMVAAMRPGSIIVDIAAETGGNCDLTQPDETVVEHGVTILGPTNLPATVPNDASRMYARTVLALLLELWRNNELCLRSDDEIAAGILVTREGEIVHPRVRELAAASAPPRTIQMAGQAG